jgi:hypothetical protein
MSIAGRRLCSALYLSLAVCLACAQAPSGTDYEDLKKLCGPVAVTEPVCSYTALNPSCNVFINRFSPVAPPTIYARHGAVITVTVVNQSPFEQLTLDLKSLTAQVPPDQLANGFAALSGALGSFAIVEALPMGELKNFALGEDPTPELIKDQKALLDQIKTSLPVDAKTALEKLKVVLLPFPVGECQGRDPAQDLEPWLQYPGWLLTVKGKLETAKNSLSSPTSDSVKVQIKGLENRIYKFAVEGGANSYQLQILSKNQDSLNAALASRDQMTERLDALSKAVDSLAKKTRANFTISDPQPHDRNYQIVTSTLNYTNRLAPVAKRVGGDKFIGGDAALLSGLGDAPAKQPIVTMSVQYMNSPRFEISAGFLVPVTPYHSYSAAQTETASTPVVRETLTYTVVPAAMIHFLIGREWIMARQRAALLATFAVGYTPATSSVALAFGPSFSWKSVVISPLADVSRDLKLAGGFTVGGPLGSSTTPAAAPLTNTVWDVKPAIGMSIRIPLSGSGH